MSEAVIIGAVVGDAVSKLSDVVIDVLKKSWQFRSKLTQIQETITRIEPILSEIEKLNKVLNRPKHETDMFINQLKAAEDLIRKCEHIKWYSCKMYGRSLKLDNLNASLLRFFQIEVRLQEARDVKEVLAELKSLTERMEKRSWAGCSSSVPLLKVDVIGFDDQITDVKAMVLNDSEVDDCSVVVVSAAGGCGKTTLVIKLCHDPQIQGKFGENIYFATISETPNLKVVLKDLLSKNDQQLDFTSDEDAVHRWGRFLRGSKSGILLVLDDVWHESIVTDFKFKLRGYKILVTSRMTFSQFDTYELQLLNHKDATNLFCQQSGCGSTLTDIPADLVDELVKCCKKHPLAISVIGGMLKGKHVDRWRLMLNKLSERQQSVLDLDNAMRIRLARSLDVFDEDFEIKQCYLDLGLFPGDQKIAATTLMDIWVHLYGHDEKGKDTLWNLYELSTKNLATMLPIRKDSQPIVNFCEEHVVMQHDMMRALALYLTSQGLEEHRKRLIINVKGEYLPQLPQTINARLLSISTDERFSMRWNDDIQVPKVEVFVLNIMSKAYTLPQFMQNMERLKVLIITNYGYYFSELHNFPAPDYLSGITSIRLEHISIYRISTSLLELVNLRKLSLIKCQIGNSFNKCTPNKLPSLLEIEINCCYDLVTFPAMFCSLARLTNLTITDCYRLISLSEGFGNLTNLEALRLAFCSKVKDLPESMRNLQKLRIIDLSHCCNLHSLPARIGDLGNLRTIHMRGCTGLHDLPSSVKDLCPLEVVCDEEISLLWSHLQNVKVRVLVGKETLGLYTGSVRRSRRAQWLLPETESESKKQNQNACSIT